MLNWLGVYYFYICAEECDDAIDPVFEPFLCNKVKGSTATNIVILDSESSLTGDDNSDSRTPPTLQSKQLRDRKQVEKEDDKEVNKAISAISQKSKTIAEEMKRSNDLEEVKLKIEIAKALGDVDMLRQLLQGISTVH